MTEERQEGLKRQYLANLRKNPWWEEFIAIQIQQYRYYKNKRDHAQTVEDVKTSNAVLKNIEISLMIQKGTSKILEEQKEPKEQRSK
jgi:hypothetical protein